MYCTNNGREDNNSYEFVQQDHTNGCDTFDGAIAFCGSSVPFPIPSLNSLESFSDQI